MCCANCRATEVCILIYSSSKLQKLTLLSTSCLCKLVTLIMTFGGQSFNCWVVQAICVQKKIVFNTIVYKPEGNTFIFPSLQHILPCQLLQEKRSSRHKNCIGGLKLILETQLKSLQRLLPRI